MNDEARMTNAELITNDQARNHPGDETLLHSNLRNSLVIPFAT